MCMVVIFNDFQAAVGWEYEGKTEAHASQKGAFFF